MGVDGAGNYDIFEADGGGGRSNLHFDTSGGRSAQTLQNPTQSQRDAMDAMSRLQAAIATLAQTIEVRSGFAVSNSQAARDAAQAIGVYVGNPDAGLSFQVAPNAPMVIGQEYTGPASGLVAFGPMNISGPGSLPGNGVDPGTALQLDPFIVRATRVAGEVGLAVGGIFFEPLDWAATAREIYNEPKSPWSYAGLIPFVPAAVGKIGKAAYQFKKLSPGEIDTLIKAGYHPHDLKPNSKFDLFKDDKGNIFVLPKNGNGPGDPTGININNPGGV